MPYPDYTFMFKIKDIDFELLAEDYIKYFIISAEFREQRIDEILN